MTTTRTPASRLRTLVAVLLTAFVAGGLGLTSSGQAHAAATFPTLSYGQTGTNVRALQYLLNAHGIATSVDSSYGPATRASVTTFQSKHALSATGTADSATMAKVTPTAQYGNPNPNTVKAVQTLLVKNGAGVAIDGEFGPATRSAVAAFQTRHGIAADGVVGPATWALLFTSSDAPTWNVPIPQQYTNQAPAGYVSDPDHTQWQNCGPASMVSVMLRLGKTPAYYSASTKGRYAVYYARHNLLKMGTAGGTSVIGGATGVVSGFTRAGISTYKSNIATALTAAQNGKPSMVGGDARVLAGYWQEHVSRDKDGNLPKEYLGHWIAVLGHSGGKYLVMDPLAYDPTPRWVTPDKIYAFGKGWGETVIVR